MPRRRAQPVGDARFLVDLVKVCDEDLYGCDVVGHISASLFLLLVGSVREVRGLAPVLHLLALIGGRPRVGMPGRTGRALTVRQALGEQLRLALFELVDVVVGEDRMADKREMLAPLPMRASSQCVIKWRDGVSKGMSGLIVCLERPYVPSIFTIKHLATPFAHVLKEIDLVRRV